MSLNEIERKVQDLIKAEIGLYDGALGDDVLRSAVRIRIQATNQSDISQYFRLLLDDASELHQLSQHFLVSESWFEREPATLKLLIEDLNQKRLSGLRNVRMLSAPCARGEEAVTLFDCAIKAGFSASEVSVTGVDCSDSALGVAQQGSYSKYSLRESSEEFINRYFDRCRNLFVLKRDVLARITYLSMNLIREASLLAREGFDVIFCRNLLIYLGSEERDALLDALTSCLRPGGVFCVGVAESALVSPEVISQRSGYAPNFFVKRPAVAHKSTVISPPIQSNFKPNSGDSRIEPEDREFPVSDPSELPEIPLENDGRDDFDVILNNAFEYADRGDLAQAKEWCLAVIDKNPLNAEGHFLFALLMIAEGCEDLAMLSLRRVLYLDPSHEEALLQFNLRSEQFRVKREGGRQ